jgi:Protein of unknown function (DUF3631)
MTTAADILRAAGITIESTVPGRYYTTCSKCSVKRKKPHQKLQCLGVTIDDRGVKWGCNHCGWKGGEYFERSDASRSGRKRIAETYPYVDESGTLLFEVIRYEPKCFNQRRPNGNGGWTWKLGNTRRVLYRLPELIEAIALKHPILIAEGEKDVNRLRDLGLAATCNPGGANKWRSDFDEVFRGADVVLIPDDDEQGWQHVNAVGTHLKGTAARVRVLLLPNAKDASAWIEAGGNREQLDQLIEGAPDWVEPAIDNTGDKTEATKKEDELIEALARMRPGIEFDRQRKKAAKDLGVNRSAIDDEIEVRRSNHGSNYEKEAAPLYGHWITDPWPEVVDGESLLRDIIKRILRHVIISDYHALVVALWIMLAWVHDEVAVHSPILNINSPEPESAKSTMLGLVAFLAPRCIASVDISEAALYRAIKLWSFIVDEFDDVLVSDDKTGLRAVINSGHTRGQGVVRCIGDDKTPELFPTFCPKALGMCGRMPAATLSRCIFIEIRRKRRSETVEKFLNKDDGGLAELRSRLARWAVDNEDALRDAKPSMPAELINRRADNWCLQFAIADLCLADWGDRARAAALTIEGKADSRTQGARLLYDIKKVYDADGGHCMHSATLVAKLIEDPEKPWAEFTRGKPLTQARLARLLGAYQIYSQTVSPPGLKDGKGYYRSQFEDAWERYASSPIDEDLSSFAS